MRSSRESTSNSADTNRRLDWEVQNWRKALNAYYERSGKRPKVSKLRVKHRGEP